MWKRRINLRKLSKFLGPLLVFPVLSMRAWQNGYFDLTSNKLFRKFDYGKCHMGKHVNKIGTLSHFEKLILKRKYKIKIQEMNFLFNQNLKLLKLF